MDDPWKVHLSMLPSSLREGVRAWIEDGQRPGDFLYSVICGDFFGAVQRADFANKHALHTIGMYFVWYAPGASWGTREDAELWERGRGLKRFGRPSPDPLSGRSQPKTEGESNPKGEIGGL